MIHLKHFKRDEILLSNQEAWQVLVWFFGGNAKTTPSWLTEDDRSFAQALLVAAVDASADVGIFRRIWESTVTPPQSIGGLLLKIARTGTRILRDRLEHADVKNFGNTKIYQMVKNQLTREFRSAWEIRIEDGQPVAY